jgi:hypothetical protein
MKSAVRRTGNVRGQTWSNFEMNHNLKEDHSNEITVYSLEQDTFKGTLQNCFELQMCFQKSGPGTFSLHLIY